MFSDAADRNLAASPSRSNPPGSSNSAPAMPVRFHCSAGRFHHRAAGITMDVDTMSDIPALLERFRRGPELLAVVLTGVFGEEEDFLPAPGKWSIRQIVAHLADAEMVGAHRFRQVIAEDNPTLMAFDQDAWARWARLRLIPK